MVPEESVAKSNEPEKLIAEIGSLPTAAYTAYQCIFTKLKLEFGKPKLNKKFIRNIVVTAASGGVGTFAIQFLNLWRQSLSEEEAKLVRIIATCSARNFEYVRGLGATHVIDYADNLEKHIKEVLHLYLKIFVF